MCELNSLCRNNGMPSPSPSTSSSTNSLSSSLTAGHSLRSTPIFPHSQISQSINSLADSFNTATENRSNLKIRFQARCISKVNSLIPIIHAFNMHNFNDYFDMQLIYICTQATTTERRLFDSSHRMRPYYIPERSRTKSENSMERDASSAIYPEAANSFTNAINSNSSSTSMMETCDGYVITDTCNPNNGQAYGFNNTFAGQIASGSNCNYNQTQQLSNQQAGRARHLSLNQIKKSKSLEDIRVENIDGSQPSHEMEFVSSRIQKLKVQE